MGRAKCGCMQWETKSGDTEEYLCPRHAGPTICPVNERENCKHLHIESEDEWWCEHPAMEDDKNLARQATEDYCPLDEEDKEE